jgi:hypothetical protein
MIINKMIVEMRELIIDYRFGNTQYYKYNFIKVIIELLNYWSVRNVLNKITFQRLVK